MPEMGSGFRISAWVVAAGLTIYVVSYLCLSVNGRFEPSVIGTNGVKCYDWAPYGFVDDYRWNRPLMVFFLPLHALDDRCWHTSDDAYDGRYPVNVLRRQDVGIWYRKWGLVK